ncbi:MAG: aldo/keto reductase [Lachnospiraceae bacterium]|nr:aldo/keto reductase [Lachnospiraceae bacterium]
MQYAELGHSGIKVSRVCAGCMSYGKRNENYPWILEKEDTEQIVKRALDLGINFFDTANVYANGTSEEYLGSALRNNAARDQVVVATKVFYNKGHLSKQAIEREIDASLKRLGMDYIDLYIIHRFDKRTPVEETMEALDGLIKAGKVRAIGASSMYAYQFYKMQIAAKENGWTQFTAMEDHYNLLYREEEREMIPLCREMNVALMPYSSLAGGRLTKAGWAKETLRSQTDSAARMKYDGTRDTDIVIVDRVEELAKKYGCKMSQIALAWHFAKGITSPIVGATKPVYFEDADAALEIALTEEDVNYLEEAYLPHKVFGPV